MNLNRTSMNKRSYLSPTSESLGILQESVICGSFDGVDNTEFIVEDDELPFDTPPQF